MTNVKEIEEFILSYIKEQGQNPDHPLSLETDYVASGLLDSFAILNLIMMLESTYDIKFKPEELAQMELRLIGKLAALTFAKTDHA